MARMLCSRCERPMVACICQFIVEINNKTAVLVLQHPSEGSQTKGTVALLQHSLNDCRVLVGEDFSNHSQLNELLSQFQTLLLYPSEQASILTINNESSDMQFEQHTEQKKPLLLIIIDGTWKKAYRMFMLSKNLHPLTQVCLPEVLANTGQYSIRKVAKKNALSSLEATCYALALLEGELEQSVLNNVTNNCEINNSDIKKNELKENDFKANTEIESIADKNSFNIYCGRYQPLIENFLRFNQFQLSFRK